jgi:hypothetical protein
MAGHDDADTPVPQWAAPAEDTGTIDPPYRGHAFISYVREDSSEVDALQRILEAAGVPVPAFPQTGQRSGLQRR